MVIMNSYKIKYSDTSSWKCKIKLLHTSDVYYVNAVESSSCALCNGLSAVSTR
jgi:hypothetical protein